MKNGGWLDNIPQAQEGEALYTPPKSHYKRLYGHAKDYSQGENKKMRIDPNTGYGYFPPELSTVQQKEVPDSPWNVSRFLFDPFIRNESQGVHNAKYDKEGKRIDNPIEEDYFSLGLNRRERYDAAKNDITNYYKEDLKLNDNKVEKKVDDTMDLIRKMRRTEEMMQRHNSTYKDFQNYDPQEVFKSAVGFDELFPSKSMMGDKKLSPAQAKRAYKMFQKTWRGTSGKEARQNSREELKKAEEAFKLAKKQKEEGLLKPIKPDPNYVPEDFANGGILKNGGWLDNYNDSQASAPEGMVGDGFSNVGRNYSPAWGGSFQEGGEIPNAQKGKKVKYVESKNDPRYKAYNDSLNSYNTGNKVLNKLKTILENNQKSIRGYENENNNYAYATTDYIKQPYKKPEYGSNKKGISPKGQGKDLEKWIKKELDPVNWKSQLPIAEALKELDKNNVLPFRSISSAEIPTISIYKKPEEEVIVQRPQEQIIQNLQPIGIQNDFNIEADIPQIRQQIRQPKYYNIQENINQPFGGHQTNYRSSDLSNITSPDNLGPGNTRNITPVYQKGGKLKFLQPTDKNLPEGYMKGSSIPSTERAMSIGGENGEPAYLIPSFKYGQELLGPVFDPISEFKRTGEHLGGPFKTWQEADEWENTVRHPAVEKGETIMFPQEQFQTGGSLPGSVGFTYARTKGIPSNGPYAKKTMASAQNGKEMQYYQNGLDWKPKTISREGSIIKDDMGQYNHPGEITEIDSPYITMKGVPYPVLGISDTGDMQMMYPEEEYEFDGEKVTEYPMAKNGRRQEQKGLVNLDQLTNFTNYNTKQPGGWLDTL
jgi:hypothetical protein